MNRASYREDYYFTLGVRENATADEIREAYRTLMKQYHPDLNKGNARANERGKRINEAYGVLSDPKKRVSYDKWLNNGETVSTQSCSHQNETTPERAHRTAPQGLAQEVLGYWYRQHNIISRLLSPSDFLMNTQFQDSEAFYCLRGTTDYLVKNIQHPIAVERMSSWDQLQPNTDMRDYIPPHFQQETVTMVESRTEILCKNCSGRGWNRCEPRIECDRYEPCDVCNGEGRTSSKCHTCDGYGKLDYRTTCYPCRGRGRIRNVCRACNGRRLSPCHKCGGSGSVICERCHGSGRVGCKKCDEYGKLVQAQLLIHEFSKKTENRFACEGAGDEDFRNGLKEGQFSGLQGDLMDEEMQAPSSANVVRQRLRVERFDVQSYKYLYNGNEFFVNRIIGHGTTHPECASRGLPVSLKRLAVAVVCGLALLIGAIMLLGILAG